MVAIFGFLATLLTPENADRVTSAIYPAIGAVVGAVVGFGVIYLVMLVIALYKQRNEARYLLSEIPSKRKVIADRLAEFYLSGNNLKLMIAEEGFNEDAISLVRDWAEPLKEYCYAEPDVLGESAILAFSPQGKDWVVFGPSGLPDNERDYAFRHLSIQLEKLSDMVMELRR